MDVNNIRKEVLKIKDFRHFALGRFFYMVALRMVFTIMGYLVYKISGSKVQLGLIGLSEVIPAIALALYAGIIVDKANKLKLILQCEIGYLILSILLVVYVWLYQISYINGQQLIVGFYIAMFIGGIIRAFNGPAQNAIIGQLVPKHLLVIASTMSSIVWLSAAVTGPLLAGVLLYYFSFTVVFVAIAIIVLIALLLKSQINAMPILVKKEVKNWDAIKEGIKFVWNTKIILGALSLDLFAVLFGGAIALLPVFATDILHVNTVALGWLNAAEYIGSAIIMFLFLVIPMVKNQGRKLFIAVAGFGVCTILFALSTNFYVSFFALIAIGLFDGVSVVIRGNITQLYTPDAMRGRVSSVNSMFINSSNEIGQFESGLAAALMGTVNSVVFGGCVTLLVVVIVWFKAKSLRELQY
jgi:MFS family permease